MGDCGCLWRFAVELERTSTSYWSVTLAAALIWISASADNFLMREHIQQMTQSRIRTSSKRTKQMIINTVISKGSSLGMTVTYGRSITCVPTLTVRSKRIFSITISLSTLIKRSPSNVMPGWSPVTVKSEIRQTLVSSEIGLTSMRRYFWSW